MERQRQQEREEQENLINVLRHQVMDADLMLGRMKNRSLWLDLKIVFWTAIYILSGKKF